MNFRQLALPPERNDDLLFPVGALGVRVGPPLLLQSDVFRVESKLPGAIVVGPLRTLEVGPGMFGLLLAVGIGYTGGFIMLAMMAMIGVGVALGIG